MFQLGVGLRIMLPARHVGDPLPLLVDVALHEVGFRTRMMRARAHATDEGVAAHDRAGRGRDRPGAHDARSVLDDGLPGLHP